MIVEPLLSREIIFPYKKIPQNLDCSEGSMIGDLY